MHLCIATPKQISDAKKLAYTEFSPKHTIELETWIDNLDSQLSPLHNFVIPSGGMCRLVDDIFYESILT